MRLSNAGDEDREDDLAFMNVLRHADAEAMELLRTNLAFGGPRWMVIAVERAIERRKRGSVSRLR